MSYIGDKLAQPSTHAAIATVLQAVSFFFPQYGAILSGLAVAFGGAAATMQHPGTQETNSPSVEPIGKPGIIEKVITPPSQTPTAGSTQTTSTLTLASGETTVKINAPPGADNVVIVLPPGATASISPQ